VLSRVADDLFWLSRYLERAISTVRLIDVTWHLELDVAEEAEADLWAPVLGYAAGELQVHVPGRVGTSSQAVRRYLGLDPGNPNSLVSCIASARAAARGVRESISSEMWEQLNTLYLSLVDPRLSAQAEADPHGFYRRVRDGAQFFQGLADSTLAHDEPWHFFCLGKYLERADDVTRILNLQTHLLRDERDRDEDTLRWLAVLRSCGSAEAYARYYSLRVDPARAIEFLLLNPVFPQSVRFSLGAAANALAAIAEPRQRRGEPPSPAVRALGLLYAELEHAAVDEVLEQGFPEFLADVQRRIVTVCEHVTAAYLRDEPRAGRLVASARAAMIMAAQQ